MQFCGWLVKKERLVTNPVLKVTKPSGKAVRKRRALSVQELQKLLDATRIRPVKDFSTIRTGPRKGQLANLKPEVRKKLEMLGRERALIYKSAVYTGPRRNELASLRVNHLVLDAKPCPHLILPGDHTKNGEQARLLLIPVFAEELREWIKDTRKLPEDLLFSVPNEMVKAQVETSPSSPRWVSCRPGFFLPVRVLSRVFRGKFRAGLRRLFAAGTLAFPDRLASLAEPRKFAAWQARLGDKEWVVHAKPPFGGPERVLNEVPGPLDAPGGDQQPTTAEVRARPGDVPLPRLRRSVDGPSHQDDDAVGGGVLASLRGARVAEGIREDSALRPAWTGSSQGAAAAVPESPGSGDDGGRAGRHGNVTDRSRGADLLFSLRRHASGKERPFAAAGAVCRTDSNAPDRQFADERRGHVVREPPLAARSFCEAAEARSVRGARWPPSRPEPPAIPGQTRRHCPLETESRWTKTLAGLDEHRLGSTSSRA
jgi:hypothetical protein